MRRAAALGLAAAALGAAAATPLLSPLGEGAWRIVGLPQQKPPMTRLEMAEVDGRRALRVQADGSYGNLVHEVASPVPGLRLAWQWRLDQPVAGADLRRKEGDDAALKVCAMFDLPLEALPFWERQKMRLARSLSGENLPAATLCYVWDPQLAAGTRLPNAYTPRLRWWVLRGSGAPLAQWQTERRDLAADLRAAFGDEVAAALPPLSAIAVGADADNTGGRSLGWVAGVELAR